MLGMVSGSRAWFGEKGGRLLRWEEADLVRPADRMLALVRLGVFFGAAAWTALAPVPGATRLRCALLLAAFFAYGVAVYWLGRRMPERIGRISLAAMTADLAFLYLLLRETGGVQSPFLPAAFLLAVLAAFHYGPGVGVLAAWAALTLAAASDPASFSARHWSEFPLAFILATLAAGGVGWLAQREARERRDIERLHDQLRERAADLADAYGKCRQMQDHLLHSERLAVIGRMSAEMAHQVRNPLSSISLNLEMLEDEIRRAQDLRADEARGLIRAIQQEIDNLAELTESHLNFANLPPFRWEAMDLNEMVEAMLLLARPQIERRSAQVTRRLEEGLPALKADRRQLKFAVMNVLSNALEAIPEGGRLRIRTQRRGERVELMVADTGPGIAAEDLPRVFEPFFTTKAGGTGLGLPLAQRIVQGHGGRIACRSIPGVGTTFTVSLPVDGLAEGHTRQKEEGRKQN